MQSSYIKIKNYIRTSFAVYKPLLFVTLILLAFGLIMFGSASLGVLERNEIKFYSIVRSQFIYALLAGTVAMFIGLLINVKYYYKFAPYIFGAAIILNMLVFVPGMNRYHGGAHRWLDVAGFSLQPSEILKIALIIFTSWLMIKMHERNNVLIFLALLIPVAGIMFLQKDTGTMLIMLSSAFIIYFVSGANWRDIIILALLGLIGISSILYFRPYAMSRLTVFLHPEQDLTGQGYQVRQSLIAIGQGGLTGRGVGQGVQKFSGYLPEPISDSIFAVIGEEIGLIGSSILLLIYLYIIVVGIYIAKMLNNQYNKLLAIGITSMFGLQALLNIGAIIGVLPLTGIPLPLVSHGGTALLTFMFSLGILFNLSKYINKNRSILI